MTKEDMKYREDLIRMAREAGLNDEVLVPWAFEIERFATLVAAAAKSEEREACALLSEEYVCGNKASIEQDFIAESIAADIRANCRDCD